MTTVSGTRRPTALALAATGLALALVTLSGCSGGSTTTTAATVPAGSAASPAPIDTSAAQSPAPPASDDASAGGSAAGASSTEDSGGGAGSGGGDSATFCGLVKQQIAVISGAELGKLVGDGSPAAWKTYLDKAAATNQQLVDAAPADIRATVVTVQQTSLAIRTVIAAAGYDVSKAGATAFIKVLNDPQRIAASKKLTTYVKDTCSIDLAKSVTS